MRTGIDDLAQRALYAEYRRRLDARAVLEYYDAQNCSELSGSDGTTEIVHSCLIDRVEPHHTNGDANPSACLNIDRKLYTCYANGWGGDLFHFIAKMEGKATLAEALPAIGQFLVGATTEADDFRAELDRLLTAPGAGTIELPTYHDRVLAPWELVHPYLYEERGISMQAATKLRLGFDERENRIVFPHFVDGKLLGWQKRTIPARPGWPGTVPDYPKYRNSSGLPKSETLYNLDAARDFGAVIVVESPMSVARAVSLGFDNVVATFGAKVSDHQIGLLKDFDTVWVWLDADPAGLAGERKIVEALYRHAEVHVVIADADRDLGDVADADEVLAKLAASVPAALRLSQYGRRHRR